MNRDDYLNNCAKFIGRLNFEIRAFNALGRFDINSVAEDFLIPILKVVFDCPDLQNQNEIIQNFPSVDLGCRKSRISFQITADASSNKIVKTLEKFREHGLEKIFDRVYVLTLVEKQTSYAAKSLVDAIAALPVPFKPEDNILDVTDILSRIQRLETSKIESIESYLSSEFIKHDEHLKFREQLDKFLEFSQSKIEVEKSSKKYIPSIFVETHTTKEEMRLFSNPLFFYRKVQDLIAKIDYTGMNSLLRLAKQPEISFDLKTETLKAVPSTFTELDNWLSILTYSLSNELQKIGPLTWNYSEYGTKYKPVHGNTAHWSIARFRLESAATSLSYLLKKAASMLTLMRNKIFLVTSMAGQGKTNFVCDLIDNQFRSFEVPCIFIPARELNQFPPQQRLIDFISNNRYAPKFKNIHEYLALFNSVAKECKKPFLIVIDGINEVNSLEEFNYELKSFCNAICQYDLVKIVITCRSEFFDEKYASILEEPFKHTIHRVKDLRSKMSDLSKNRLLESYVTHFNITGHLSGAAQDFLKNDLLLLRIFCERHEGEDVGNTSDIYKGDLFEDFLFRKIKSFPEHVQGKTFSTLLKIASAMLTADDFSTLSVRDFSIDEQEIVRRLVAEDVVLRQEIAVNDLSRLGDLIISFTYDELRDFIIAYKLVEEVTDEDAKSLKDSLLRHPKRPIFEGVFKYVYLRARKINKVSVLKVCEGAEDFIEHYSLNAHLLPPSVQNKDDVARLNKILSDASAPERTRRITLFLLGRMNSEELININILIDHLNELETENHEDFIRIIFSHAHDFGSQKWQQRIDELTEKICEDGAENSLTEYAPEWLAFFLHAASSATWFERDCVSTLFKKLEAQMNCRHAIDLVRSAKSQTVFCFLSSIKALEEVK